MLWVVIDGGEFGGKHEPRWSQFNKTVLGAQVRELQSMAEEIVKLHLTNNLLSNHTVPRPLVEGPGVRECIAPKDWKKFSMSGA